MTDVSNRTAMLKALDLALGRVDKIMDVLAEDPKKILNGWKSPSGAKVGGISGMPPYMLDDTVDAQRVGMMNGYATAIGDLTKALKELKVEIEQGVHP